MAAGDHNPDGPALARTMTNHDIAFNDCVRSCSTTTTNSGAVGGGQ